MSPNFRSRNPDSDAEIQNDISERIGDINPDALMFPDALHEKAYEIVKTRRAGHRRRQCQFHVRYVFAHHPCRYGMTRIRTTGRWFDTAKMKENLRLD